MNHDENRRILIIDDNPSIHEDFRKILAARSPAAGALDAQEAALFGTAPTGQPTPGFELASAFQGEEGLKQIDEAQARQQPFALAFVDLRMPPGWDGVETIERILPVDPNVQIVICSAYSDYSAQDILERLGVSDRLLLLRKPCDAAEILLIATSLCTKWNVTHSARGLRNAPCASATI